MRPAQDKFYRHLNRIRYAAQIFSLLFLLAVPVLNWLGIHWIIGTLYSLSIGELDITDPVMAVQTILLTRAVYVPLLLAVAAPVLLALVFGRVFCSWMCPQNTFSEWIDLLQKRFFRARWRKVHAMNRGENPKPMLYWAIFAGLVVITAVIGLPLLSYLSLPGIISSQMAQTILGMGMGLEIGLVVLVLAIELVVARRFWCKYLCPVGAMLALFRTDKTMHLRHREAMCDCKSNLEPCHDVCPLHLSPKHGGVYPYCFNCGLCITVCEKTGNRALVFELGKPSNGSGARQGDIRSPQLNLISKHQE